MGNRDARGREKKKPKKAVAKPSATPPPRVAYKPVSPTPAPAPSETPKP